MSVGKRLHLDEVVSSFPELGPTVPDGGYSWVVLCGVCLVQMTIPSILSMYGVVLGFINESRPIELSLSSENIMLTPILFIAFWNLADPWTRMIVNMASIPRLVGIIGVTLLTVGILATGYLATGGVGAYLASSSAGAVMGIGASFVVLLSDYVLRKNFRKKLLLALTLKNIATSIGLIIIPSITDFLLRNTGLKSGLQLMTITLIPTALGALTFRLPSAQPTSPYSLLLSEEDNEIPIRTSSDAPKNTLELNSPRGPGNHNYGDADELFNEGNNMYAYQEPDEDVDLFVSPLQPSESKWKQQLQLLKNLRFWMAVVGLVGMKVCTLFFWLLLPVISSMSPAERSVRVLQCTMAGFGTLLPNIASYKILQLTNHNRRIYFGLAAWFCAVILIGLTYARGSTIVKIWAILGGISIGSLSSCQDLALYDVMGIETMRSVNKGFSTIVGLCILVFSFVRSVNFCMNVTSALLFFGGLFWLWSPILSFMESTRYRQSCAANA